MFISIEGCDGSGKGTLIDNLKSWFQREGVRVEYFHDPGSTDLGESLRSLLLDRSDVKFTQRAEMALFMASRAQLVREKILPALKKEKIVLVDRYLLSTVVYQGYACKASPDEIARIWRMGRYMAYDVMPDLTFVLDCSAERAAQRLDRPKDRIEQKSLEYHERIVGGYRRAVRHWNEHAPGMAFTVDAEQTPEKVFNDVVNVIIRNELLSSGLV